MGFLININYFSLFLWLSWEGTGSIQAETARYVREHVEDDNGRASDAINEAPEESWLAGITALQHRSDAAEGEEIRDVHRPE